MNNRRVAAGLLTAALLVPALIGALRLAGWTGGDAADGNRSPGGAADSQALRDFTRSLQSSRDLVFTATYTTAGGTVVTHAQEPPRRAYRSGAGLYLTAPDATFMCRTPAVEQPRCNRAAGGETVPLSHARELAGVLAGDFISPELATAHLSRLAARVPGRVQRSERTIAGQPTSCIAIAQVFTGCVTRAGVLALFEAPDGQVTLTAYRPTVAAEVFTLPRDAAMTDI